MLKFFAEKMWVAFAVQKLLTFFSAKNFRILYIESAKTVNEMTLNELVKLTTLWTTGPWITNSEDSDQLASSEANWFGSTLFEKTGLIWIQQEQG